MLKIGRYVEQKPFPRDSRGSRHAALFLIGGYRHRPVKEPIVPLIGTLACVGGGARARARGG